MSNTSEAMLNNCFKRSLEKVPLNFAKEMVESHPNNKHFRLWYHGRQRSAEMLENTTVLSTWAEGSVDEDNIMDKIHADLKTSGVSSADVNALKELVNMCEGMDKAKVLVYISGHLAVASVELRKVNSAIDLGSLIKYKYCLRDLFNLFRDFSSMLEYFSMFLSSSVSHFVPPFF
ncbi:uncharacterized protein LOC103514776 [Diaphorina citri]|uniref:Uncharacterized protein LOC103514776 n=1 Tax=Diaphorina citri TaxID=121845 RepID=A0A3Q0J9R5_DIACI|nr:uncharacterized protein LOC103514776 [Diaphorina citri]